MNNNHYSESVVLGTLLADPSLLPEVEDILSVEDFVLGEHRKLFADIVKRNKDERPIDIFGINETTGISIDRLITIYQQATGYNKNALQHAKKIKTAQKRARLAQIIHNNISAIQNEENAVEDIMERLTTDIFKVSETESDKKGYVHINQTIKLAYKGIEERVKAGGKLVGLSTGLTDLDDLLKGLKPGKLVVIAGRPSMGKTVVAMNIMEHNALKGENCYIHSKEMTKEELTERAICSVGSVDYAKLQDGRLCDTQFGLVSNAFGQLQNKHLYIDDTPGLTVAQIRAAALRKKAEIGHISAIMIDYLQLIKITHDNRTTGIGEVSTTLKNLGKEIGCPIILVSQLSRKCEERSDKRPMSSDLRDSGQIEQDADIIIMVYRDSFYNEQSPWGNISELIVTKNRGGKTGKVYAEFQGQHQRFVNADYHDVERIKNIASQESAKSTFKRSRF